MTIWFASGNKNKLRELSAILAEGQIKHELKLPADAEIMDFAPPETGASFMENALIKARALYHQLNSAAFSSQNLWKKMPGPIIADDSGLCVDALDGKPGIYSAVYYGKNSWTINGKYVADSGISAKLSDNERNRALLEELDMKDSMDCFGNGFGAPNTNSANKPLKKGPRTCRFVCAMAILFDVDRFYLVQETMKGEIISSAAKISGTGGFGYDPIVLLPEFGQTVAELSDEEKNRISHRGKAARIIAKILH